MKHNVLGVALALSAVSASPFYLAPAAHAQSVTSGDISGSVTDATGGGIANAEITATNTLTGVSQKVTASAVGSYRFSLLVPGTYKVTATASGFGRIDTTVVVSAGAVTADDLKLQVGNGSTTVEVTAEAPVVNTENGDVITAYTSEQVQALPNPGNDLTFVAQTAPGTVMNTGTASGGYGNFVSFGISALSNMFTLDGGYENDPFLNLNNTGAANLTLGNNEVETVTVVSPAFSAQYGGLGGAQVNEITRAGGNRVHGQAQYYWSGRALNANDFFNKQSQVFNGEKNQAQFVNANQWAASIGGPFVKDRLFWFVNTEGLRVTTPVSGQVYSPTTAFQNCSINGVGCDTLTATAVANCANNPSSTCVGDPTNGYGPFTQAPASQRPLLQTIYNVYNNSPFRPAASSIIADPNDVSVNTYYAKAASSLNEYVITGRLDYKIGDNDNFYVHYKQDKGVQPTYVDLLDPRFSASSPQPSWEGQMNETHTFSPNIINQLVVTGNYYSAPFQNTNNYLPVAPFTFSFGVDGDLGNGNNGLYGGENYAFPQGRRVTGYQVVDDLSWTRGTNTLKFGYNFRRNNVTDLPQNRAIAPLLSGSVEGFGAGQVDNYQSQYFPVRQEQPIAVYNEGFYVQDTYKPSSNLTLTAGLRFEINSNPTCLTNCFAYLAADINSLPTGAASQTTPYNAATPGGGFIQSGQHQVFKSYQPIGLMPRVSFAWQPSSSGKTVIRGGFGMFTDSFPGLIADRILNNPPTNFKALALGPLEGGSTLLLDPSTAGSGGQVVRASNAAFQNGFSNGGTYNSVRAGVLAAGAGTYSTPTMQTVAGSIKYPTYEEFSLALEQQIDRRTSVSVLYVGNHGYHEPVADASRNLSTARPTANFFTSVPTTKPITPFGVLTNTYSGASSNFHGVVVSAQRHAKELTMLFNYQFGKALDEVSNGGLEPFAPDAGDSASTSNPANLHSQYGRADYDVRHNITAGFVYEIPAYHRFRAITGGFELSGNVFHQSGLPYTILQSTTSIGNASGKPVAFANGTVNLFARQVSNNFDHHCGGSSHVLLPNGTAASPCDFTSSSAFAAPTNFTQQARNTLTGPSYTNVNLGGFKVIPIYKLEAVKLKVGAQAFNLFNHTNFQNPGHTLTGTASSTYGAISQTVSSPTNIFGSVGANSSPRLIQLKGSIVF